MKNWLKGGLILSGISFLYFILASIIAILNPDNYEYGLYAIVLFLYYFVILIIPIFGIGALTGVFIGRITRTNLSYALKGAFIGLLIGIILSILPILDHILKDPLFSFVQLAVYLTLGFSIGLITGYIVGKVKSRKQH